MSDVPAGRENAGQNALAYTAVLSRDPGKGAFSLGIAEEFKPGFVPYDKEGLFNTYEEAMEVAKVMNKQLGLTEMRAFEIVASSMGAGSLR